MKLFKRTAAWVLTLVLVLSLGAIGADAAVITSTPTGFDSADDVQYITQSGTRVNWGARGEDCVFLTTYATDCYTGEYAYDVLSSLSGGTGTSDAYNSELYDALQELMQGNHKKKTSYGEIRYLFCYTDCERNAYTSPISSFYSGKAIGPDWDQGSTWNREHTWPKSKTAYPEVSNSSINEATDIMSLRPTAVSENGSRGNKAYGESGSFFDPGESVRGDCARTMLYVYVRWGNTSHMWGSSGVMESLDVLLKWMEEDPVDTWEMGRNDSVESITGVRNVFVDYPELAWLLFGEEIPNDMVTPSGEASNAVACPHTNTEVRNEKAPTCSAEGYTGDTYCKDCNRRIATGKAIPTTAHTEITRITEPTCTKDGKQETVCDVCKKVLNTTVLSATGHTDADSDQLCDTCGADLTPAVTPTDPPVEPTDPPTEPPTEPVPDVTDPTESDPTEPTQPEASDPTDPTEPALTDPSEPATEPSEEPTQVTPTQPPAAAPGSDEKPASFLWLWLVLIAAAVIVVIIIALIVKKKKKDEA